MSGRVERQAVDFAAYPDLVVIYLGMRAYNLRGLRTLLGFGPRIARSVADKPAGLLLHETYSLRGGMEAIFIDMGSGPAGLLRALPVRPAQGTMFTARRRLGLEGESPLPPGVAEES